MDATEKYAILILEVIFKSTHLLNKISINEPGSEERKQYELELEAIKDYFSSYIDECHDEVTEAFRKNKAAQILLGIRKGKL